MKSTLRMRAGILAAAVLAAVGLAAAPIAASASQATAPTNNRPTHTWTKSWFDNKGKTEWAKAMKVSYWCADGGTKTTPSNTNTYYLASDAAKVVIHAGTNIFEWTPAAGDTKYQTPAVYTKGSKKAVSQTISWVIVCNEPAPADTFVTICHYNSEGQTWSKIEDIKVDSRSAFDSLSGHRADSADIIPAYSWDGNDFAGQNLGTVDGLTVSGAAFLANGCQETGGGATPVKVTICHYTGASPQPYTKVADIDVASVEDANSLAGHRAHGNDVIPTFVFDGQSYTGSANLGTVVAGGKTGTELLAANCAITTGGGSTPPTTESVDPATTTAAAGTLAHTGGGNGLNVVLLTLGLLLAGGGAALMLLTRRTGSHA